MLFQWFNRRRQALIIKKLSEGLTPWEQRRLNFYQHLMQWLMPRVTFRMWWNVKRIRRKLRSVDREFKKVEKELRRMGINLNKKDR